MSAFAPASGSIGPYLWILDKGVGTGGLYDTTPTCGTSNIGVYDPGGYDITTQPAHVFGAGGVPGLGTFLVKYSGLSDGTNEAVEIIAVANPLGTPTFTPFTLHWRLPQ